jgi:hypothetical protein
MSIKEMVAGTVRFQCYKENELWYKTESGFDFPVPISETGGGIYLAEDKGLFFMRFIRKHLQTIEAARQEQGQR